MRDPQNETLKLGKGAAFVKSHLRRLPGCNENWEADIRPAPGPRGNGTVWQGLVIRHGGGILNERGFEKPATVNDLARILADAMLRPFDGYPRRPQTLRIRRRLEWQAILPHLERLGVRVVSAPRLARWDRVFEDFCRSVLSSQPTSDPPPLEKLYPTLAQFVRNQGHIEVGDQQGFGFVARAVDYGGLVFECRSVKTFAEAMAALEACLADRLEGEPLRDE